MEIKGALIQILLNESMKTVRTAIAGYDKLKNSQIYNILVLIFSIIILQCNRLISESGNERRSSLARII